MGSVRHTVKNASDQHLSTRQNGHACASTANLESLRPQPWDWLSALAARRRLKSWTTGVLDANDRRPATSRPLKKDTLQNMCQVQSEAIRVRKRKWLSDATYISLASDDRKRYKLLKFKCDLGPAPPRASTELGARHGLIGVRDQFAGLTEENFDDDYGLRVAEGWLKIFDSILYRSRQR